MFTDQDRYWHDMYEQSAERRKATIDEAFEAAQEIILMREGVAAKDDRAEQLVAAITRYVDESTRA